MAEKNFVPTRLMPPQPHVVQFLLGGDPEGLLPGTSQHADFLSGRGRMLTHVSIAHSHLGSLLVSFAQGKKKYRRQ